MPPIKPSYFVFQAVRLVFALLVGIFTPDSYLWLKSIVVLWGSELLDYRPTLWVEGKNFIKPHYDILDKINDQVINFGFLVYLTWYYYGSGKPIASNNSLMEGFLWIIWVSFITRVFGTGLFLQTFDSSWLICFPNYCSELMILFSFAVNFDIPPFYIISVIILLIILKIVWEIYMPGRDTIKTKTQLKSYS